MKNRVLLSVIILSVILLTVFASAVTADAMSVAPEFTKYSEIVCEDGYAYGIRPGDTAAFIKGESLREEDIRILNGDAEVSDTAFVGTGNTIESYKYATTWASFAAVVKGDINGDGEIKSVDYLKIKKHFTGGDNTLTGAQAKAADVSGDGEIKTVDYLRLKKFFAGDIDIFDERTEKVVKYDGPYSEVNGFYGGVDSIGREMYYDNRVGEEDTDKEVGVFYFLWLGYHSTRGPFNNTQIVLNNPRAILSEAKWLEAGGGNVGNTHHWDEPVFGYYTIFDTWVIEKQVQMLTEAGIDYILFDATNAYTYDEGALLVFAALDKYAKMGYDVPHVAYYTRNDADQTENSRVTMQHIYDYIWDAHPEYQYLFYQVDDRPLMVGLNASRDVFNTFKLNKSQWPQEPAKTDGFPWMEFTRWLTPDSVYKLTKTKTVMTASPAQHNSDIMFSYTAWYGGNDRSRNYRGDETVGLYHQDLTDEQAMLYGTNFEMGLEYAMYSQPDNIFLTGWNEWGAQRLTPKGSEAIWFCDCADDNNSRDIEPSAGALKDNYYMQAANFVRQFRGAKPRVNIGENTAIDINGAWSQWDSVTAKYTDWTNEIPDRNCVGFGEILYTNTTGRNDIQNVKAARDAENLYFYVDTVSDIQAIDDANGMNLLIRSHGAGTEYSTSWEGFDFIVNGKATSSGKMTVERFNSSYTSRTEVGKVDFKLEGNKLMVKIPKAMLGISNTELVDVQFKWADNATEGNVLSYYSDGDVAPYGRFTYVFSEKESYDGRNPVFD